MRGSASQPEKPVIVQPCRVCPTEMRVYMEGTEWLPVLSRICNLWYGHVERIKLSWYEGDSRCR
jgi:hypothetical protein